MPEHKMTYQERVYNYTTALFESYNGSALVYRRDFEDSAISAVAAQAEAIREYRLGWSDSGEKLEKWLLEHGYIEPKTK